MSEEIGQGDNIANNGEVEVKSANSTHGDDPSIDFTEGEREGDNVQTSIVFKNEEQSSETPDSTEDSTEEKLPNTTTQIENESMLPTHPTLSTKPSGSTEKMFPDSSDPVIPSENHSDKITEINQQSLPFGDSLLSEAPNSEGDGPHQLNCETQDRETSSAEHGRTSAYTTSCEEYSLLLEQLTEEQANAIERNKKLQMKLAPILAKKPKEEMERIMQGDLDAKCYEECLEMLTWLKLNMKEDGEVAKRQTEELKMKAQERLSKVDKEWRDLLSLKKDVAVTVLSRRVAKPYAVAQVESALASEEQHQDELTRLRLQNFSLEKRIWRLEQEISEAERNATNPFQREYEKLHARRTERKKYREKRRVEALRVQSRVERRLETLSHVKQKLHNTESELQHKLDKLARTDAILAQHRDRLASIKRARTSLQRDNARLKEQRGLLGNQVLLRDYDYTKQVNAALEEKLQDLKCRQADFEFYLDRRKTRFQVM